MPRLVATAAALLFLVAAPAKSAPCPGNAVRCDCAGDAVGPSAFVHGFASGAYDGTPFRDGLLFEGTLLRVQEVDARGEPIAESLRGTGDRIARDFAVLRAWTRPGDRYPMFAFRDRDTLRTLMDCQKANPSERPEARESYAALDSLLTRR